MNVVIGKYLPSLLRLCEKSCTDAAAKDANTLVNVVYASSVVRMDCRKPAAGLSNAALRKLRMWGRGEWRRGKE